MLSTTDREASYCLVKGKVAWAAHDCELSIESFKASDDDLNLICEIQNGAEKCRLCSECTLVSYAVSINFFQANSLHSLIMRNASQTPDLCN